MAALGEQITICSKLVYTIHRIEQFRISTKGRILYRHMAQANIG